VPRYAITSKYYYGHINLIIYLILILTQKENVDEDIYTLGTGLFAVEVDLMQPIDPEKTPKVHIPALNHIGLWVDHLPAAVEYLTAQGVKFTPGKQHSFELIELMIYSLFL